jgi:hypothetical protein
VLDGQAVVLDLQGRCPEALRTQEQAVRALPASAPADARIGFVRRLARYRARCGAPDGG